MRLLENSQRQVNESLNDARTIYSWGRHLLHSLSNVDGHYSHRSIQPFFLSSLNLPLELPIFYPFILLLTTYLCCFVSVSISHRFRMFKHSNCLLWFNTFNDSLFSYFDWFRWERNGRMSTRTHLLFLVTKITVRVLVLPKINKKSVRQCVGKVMKKQKQKQNEKCDCKSIDKRCLWWLWFFIVVRFQYSKISVEIFRVLDDITFFFVAVFFQLSRPLLFFTPEIYIVCQC